MAQAHLAATTTPGRSAFSQGGFTLIEILIAIVVLVVGLVGIMALFPTAIDWGNKTVQDTYAASIAQSVKDAIAVGVKKNLRTIEGPGGVRLTYFLFQHDGLEQEDLDRIAQLEDLDQITTVQSIVGEPFCIVLPTDYDQDQTTATFIYPKPAEHFSSQFPGPQNITDDANRYDSQLKRIPILDTYKLDRALLQGQEKDPYGQYSFAFQISRAKIDTDSLAGNGEPDGRITAQDAFSNELFEVRIFVFRNFVESATSSRNKPIAEFTTYISL